MLSVMRPEPGIYWNIAKVLCAIFDVTAGHQSPIVKQLETSVSREVAVWSDNWTMQEIYSAITDSYPAIPDNNSAIPDNK